MNTTHEAPTVRPLSGMARLALVLTTTATITLFYLFLSVSVLCLLIWIGLMLLAALAVARFGMSGLIARYMERDFRVLGLIARSLWLAEGAAYRLPLERTDAPRLFETVDRLAVKFGIPPPDELCLEMNSGAWVQLRGLKSGLGTTRVGIGYDLLASLSEREMEAVLAHELAHAKLIGRVFHNWLRGGLNRAAAVSNSLSAAAEAARQAHQSIGLGNWILAGSDRLTHWCAHQMGAYSRQAEFEADREAARICGTAAMRSALERLEATYPRLARLPWDERVAQIESTEGLSAWLQRELSGATATAEIETVFDRYSTHPPQRDRLAALNHDGSALAPSPSGLGLLAAPDALALKLVTAIEQTALREEQKDLGELRKWLRKAQRNPHYRPAQIPGMLLVCAAIVVGAVALFSGFVWIGLLILLAGTPLGVWLARLGRYRDRYSLPVPDFATFMHARKDFPLPDVSEAEKKIDEEIKPLMALDRSARRNAARLVEEAYVALGRTDYLRAHVCARRAQGLDAKSVERKLAMMVAAAAFDQADTVDAMITLSLKATSWHSPSTTWAAAWTMLLAGNWHAAEALLHETLKCRPDHADLRAMLAFTQARRGKRRSALKNLRLICTPRAPTETHLKLLVGLLLDCGTLREATERLGEFGPASFYNPDVIELRMRLHLLRRELDRAEEEFARLAESERTGARLLNVGFLYENARLDLKAAEYFRQALTLGHYPAAHLALARLAAETRDAARAREHLHRVLDTTLTPAAKSASAYDLFPATLNQLVALEEPVANCRAWIATVQSFGDTHPLAQRSLLVFALTPSCAEAYLRSIAVNMKPDLPALATAAIRVEAAATDLQPVRPVRPGVQYVYR